MDNKAQSALEYLMTYGWALIVIAIVIGVLIFVTGSATGGVTCQSQSQALQLTEWSISSGTDGVGLTLRNATGGTITDINAATDGVKFTDTNSVVATSVTKSNTFTVTGLNGPTAGTVQDAWVLVTYRTAGGLTGNAKIICSGTVA